MKKKLPHYNIVTIGSTVRDTVFYTKHALVIKNPKRDMAMPKLMGFEFGGKVHSDEVFHYFGGGASNAAVCAARLGLHIAVVARVGHDTVGREMIRHFTHQQINTSLIQSDLYQSSGFSFLVVEKTTDEHVAFVCYGANEHLAITPKLVRSFTTDWFYVPSLSMTEWYSALQTLIATKTKIAWNPGEIQLASSATTLKRLLPHIEVLILNKDEAVELSLTTGFKPAKMSVEATIRDLATHLYQFGSKIILITNSRKGAYAYDGTKFYFERPKPDRPKDTTGAGDCFGASFVVGLIKFSGDIQAAIHLATINATAKVQQRGAQTGLQTWKQIKPLLK